MDNLYRQINGITYISPNIEEERDTRDKIAAAGMSAAIIGATIAILYF